MQIIMNKVLWVWYAMQPNNDINIAYDNKPI